MSKRERPTLGDTVEFRYHRHNRVGKIVAVAVTKTHFTVEIDRFAKVRFPSKWQTEKLNVRVALSKIVRIISKKSEEEDPQ